jgi:hypothetical protein
VWLITARRPSYDRHVTRSTRAIRFLAKVGIGLLVLSIVPRNIVGRDADALYTDDRGTVLQRADRVVAHVKSGVVASDFTTGSSRFDGEWAFGTYQMAILGLSQVSQTFPDAASRYRPAMREATKLLLAPNTHQFATEAWGSDAFASLDDSSSRDAWLGYVALSLSVERSVDPEFPYVDLHDRLIASLRKRIEHSPTLLIETYPGETYPVDVSAAIAAIDLHAHLTGGDASPLVDRWVQQTRQTLLDPTTGYLSQTGPEPGRYRGSGTSLAAYFLGFAPTPSAQSLAKDLYTSLRVHGFRSVAGFALVREYASNYSDSGDIDSGPVFIGFGVSPSGFTIASAKRQHDEHVFAALHRTAALTGVPYAGSSGKGFVVGGALGDSIMLAMETARPMDNP